MPEAVTVKVDIRDFRRQLREVGARMEKRAVSQGLRDAAKVFRDAARQAAPVLREPDKRRIPGALRAGIIIVRGKGGGRGVLRFAVTVRRTTTRSGTTRDPFYWRFLEGGWIPRGPGQRFAGGVRSRALARSRASAGRIERPFLAPAFASSRVAALAAFERGVERRLAEVQAVK